MGASTGGYTVGGYVSSQEFHAFTTSLCAPDVFAVWSSVSEKRMRPAGDDCVSPPTTQREMASDGRTDGRANDEQSTIGTHIQLSCCSCFCAALAACDGVLTRRQHG